jgi:asparagine synthase (glutamine-hydrolysing)
MDNAQDRLVSRFEELADGGFLDRTLYTDIHTYLPGDLLVKADRMTMAASLEGRSPLLDHEWAELVARLPEKWKLNGRRGKYLLKSAFGDLLPESVLSHRKQGFGIPVGAWFRGPLDEWAREKLLASGGMLEVWFNQNAMQQLLDEHSAGRVDHGKRLWALVMLNAWLQQRSK